jgi:O-antigen/teichoic acid export membrane protein
MKFYFNEIKDFLKKFPRHWIVASSAWISKIIVSLVQIVSIRTLLFYMGEDRYAVYLIAYSLINWISFAQFGIGQSVMNFISQCRAEEKPYDKYLLAALQIIVFLFVISLIIIVLLSGFIQEKLFVKFLYINEIREIPIVLILGIIGVIYAFSVTAYYFYTAIHKGYIPNIIPAICSSLSMILIVIFNRYHLFNSITVALLIFALPQAILPSILFVKVFRRFFVKLFDLDFAVIKNIFVRGVKLHGIACMSMAYGLIDYLIMSRVVVPNEIVSYNVFMRVFSSAMYIYSALLGSVYPVLAELFVKKAFKSIKRILKNYILYGISLLIFTFLGVYIFGNILIKILAPEVSYIDKSFVFIGLIACYMFVKVFYDTFYNFLMSINAVRIMWKCVPIMLGLNIIFQYQFAKIFGIKGIVMGLILSMLLTGAWVLPLKVKKVLKEV